MSIPSRCWPTVYGSGASAAIATSLVRRIRLNGHDFTVIGVTGEGFRGTTPVGGPDLWVPFAMHQQVLTGLGAEMLQRAAA